MGLKAIANHLNKKGYRTKWNRHFSITELLKQNVDRLSEIQELRERYLDAFEKRTLSMNVLQERMQKVETEKEQLEQKVLI